MVPEVAVIEVAPNPALVASPMLPVVLLITATIVEEEVHATVVVMSWVVPSPYVPVALNCWLVPRGMFAVGGLTAIETNGAGFTFRVAEVFTDPELIPIVVVPAARAIATPLVPGELLMVATLAALELQCPDWVTWDVPSVYVPVAVNGWAVPAATVAVCGLTAIEVKVAAVTVKSVVPAMEPEVAVIVAVPVPVLVATPVLLMVAVVSVSEVQAVVGVRSCWLPSLNVPMAANACVVPKAIEGLAGVTAIETNSAGVTVNMVELLTEPDVAVIVAVPEPTLLARPWVLVALLMVATVGVSEHHSPCPSHLSCCCR